MPNNDYANEPNQSRSEEIIQSILDNTEYDEPARSRIEYLLVELKNAIAGGGSGFTPTTEQLAAMNSGITAERLATDENDISTIQQTIGDINSVLEEVL